MQGTLALVLKNAAPIEDQGSDYGYSDIDIDDIDDPESPPPPAVASSSRLPSTSTVVDHTPAPRANAKGKRVRDEPMEVVIDEVEDSETERRAKEGKKRRVKCPNCKQKFNI